MQMSRENYLREELHKIMYNESLWWRCAQGKHPFPSRTRWLRPKRPMVLCWRRHGRVGGRQLKWAYSSAGQSARLISVRSVVRVHLSPLKTKYLLTQFLLSWGRSSVGRAPALQAGGQEFESLRLHCERKFTVNNLSFLKKVLTKQNKFDILQQLSKTADK